MRTLIALSLVLIAGAAQAQVCKYVAPNGVVTYTQGRFCDGVAAKPVPVTNTAAQQGTPTAERPEYIRLAVARHEVVIGMTRAELNRSAGRPPDHISTSVRSGGVDQQLVYDRGERSRLYVYLTDGVITSFTSDN